MGMSLGEWTYLDEDERQRLAELMTSLLAGKSWEAARGFTLTDEMCTVIAAQAALLVLGLDLEAYRDVRDEVRRDTGSFVEVFVKCPLDVLSERDVKGLYKKALAGEIRHFTGVDDPYEEPVSPEVTVETDRETPELSAARIINKLEELGLTPASTGYSDEDDEEVRRRLEALGYV